MTKNPVLRKSLKLKKGKKLCCVKRMNNYMNQPQSRHCPKLPFHTKQNKRTKPK